MSDETRQNEFNILKEKLIDAIAQAIKRNPEVNDLVRTIEAAGHKVGTDSVKFRELVTALLIFTPINPEMAPPPPAPRRKDAAPIGGSFTGADIKNFHHSHSGN